MTQETLYTTRYTSPDLLQRDAEQTLELPLYRDGSLVAPASGTLTILDESGVAIVDEVAVTIHASIATYLLKATSVPVTLNLNEQWQERWTLTVDGIEYLFQREAALVRRRLYPVVADLDLTRLHTELREWLADDQTSLQSYIDAAWDDIQGRLRENGKFPHLIMSPSSLRRVHLYMALSYVFTDYDSSAGGTDGKYAKLALRYDEKAEDAWTSLKFTYDFGNDGLISEADKGAGGIAVLFTCEPASWNRGML